MERNKAKIATIFAKIFKHSLSTCGEGKGEEKRKIMNSISPLDLQEKINNQEDILLIDVREDFEHTNFNIGGTLIPMNTVFENLDAIPKDKPVVLYCAKGIRSAIVIQRLEEKFGYTNLINLSGGMYGWRSFFSI
jgi:rhodanese-related sulfurtransferase